MALSRSQKESAVATIKENVTKAKTLVFVRFDKVTAEEMNALRTSCANEDVHFIVAKKTLLRKAFDGADIDGEFPSLDGEVALASSEDLLASARIMGEQSKQLEDRLHIIGGVFEGAFTPEGQMQVIADIPPLKTLYAQFLMVIRSPIQGFVSVLDQVAKK
ncbi:MAG: 50S ribosomal protein L10 [Candidatus Kaiserbacteria bacterium]|nr:50S ribosomal protein L10 [Candidatus Kaiserbacteria bacterium]